VSVVNGQQLPQGWVTAAIEDLFAPLEDGRTLHQGWSPQCEKVPSVTEEEWGVLKTTAIQPGAFLAGHNKRLPSGLAARPLIEVKAGDILITCAGPRSRCGIACLVRSTRRNLMMSGKMYRFRAPEEHIDPRYLEAYLQTAIAQDGIDRMKTGGSDSGLNLTHDRFRRLEVPVAPLNEQRRVVEAYEELVSDLDSGVAALERVLGKLKLYRAAVLKAAVEGALTIEWRQHHSATEPGPALLKRILAERRRRWEEDQLAKFKAQGQEPPNNWRAKYKAPIAPDTTNPLPLTEGWCWASADQLSDAIRSITYGVIKLGDAKNDGVPTLRSSNVRHLKLDLQYVKKISQEIAANYARTFLSGGEVLITVRGTLGGVVVAPVSCRGFNVSREVAVMAPVLDGIGKAAAVFVGSPIIQAWLARHSRGITYQGVNIGTLKELPIPLAPLGEQEAIVEAVEDQLSVIEHLEANLDAKLKSAQALRQSILRHAFTGQLVPQDPNDEPASELLKRIAAEREGSAREAAAAKRATKKPGGPRTGRRGRPKKNTTKDA